MTTVADIADQIEALAPTDLAEDFDNVGLLIGDAQKSVKKVMIMLDADKNTVEEAIDYGADLIITHHPVLFSGIKSITNHKLLRLIENKIALYSAHTNLDSANGGVNDVLAEKLSLQNVAEITLDTLKTRMGDVEECSFGDYIKTVKKQLSISHVRYVGDVSKKISKVGILGGSGADLIPQAKNAGCDVYITADMKYHQAQIADDIDLCVIDAGHFETENYICESLREALAFLFKDVDFTVSKRKNSYILYE